MHSLRSYSKSSAFARKFAGYAWTEGVSGKKKLGIKNIRIRVNKALAVVVS